MASTYRSRCGGFSIAELIVASVVATLILLGAVAVLRQTRAVEIMITGGWQDRQRANALADHLADRLASAINLKDQPAVVLASTGDGHQQVTITSAGLDHRDVAMAAYRIQWPSQGPVVVTEQAVPYAGTVPIPVWLTPEASGDALWLGAPIDTIADHIDRVSVSVRSLSDPPNSWKQEWKGQVGDVMFQVDVLSGSQDVQRIVVPRITGKAVE
jgi:hypothetical protein